MYIKSFLSLLLFFSFSFSLEVCYKGYYVFFPVIVNCINYKQKKVEAYAFSTPLGSLFKKVRYEGNSRYTYENSILIPKQFYFTQQEGKHKYIHNYIFKENTIFYEKRHYKFQNNKYIFKEKKQKTFKTKEIFFDPFTSSIYLYKVIKNKKSGYIPIFYDGRFYKVPYKVEKKEKINIDGKIYKTQKVFLNPEFKSRGLLKPTGNWYLWIDENLNIPIKMQVRFTIGSFKLVLKSLKLEEKMKVSEYHKQGLKNFVEDENLSGYELLGEAKEKVHKVRCFIKKEDGKIIDAKFNASKRCKKLLAIADLACEKIKENESININFDEILQFFKDEKEQDKMKARLEIVKKAVLGG